jgi:hypothetical protein
LLNDFIILILLYKIAPGIIKIPLRLLSLTAVREVRRAAAFK